MLRICELSEGEDELRLVSNRATITTMPVDEILSLLIAERDKLSKAIEVLQGTPRTATQRKNATLATDVAPAPNHAPKRRWTGAMRRAAAERSKAMWAAKRLKTAAKKG